MTGSIWTLGCGCEYGGEHHCRPLWMTAEEWSGTGNNGVDQVESELSRPGAEILRQGLNTPGLTTRFDLEAPVDSTPALDPRHSNTGGC